MFCKQILDQSFKQLKRQCCRGQHNNLTTADVINPEPKIHNYATIVTIQKVDQKFKTKNKFKLSESQ